MTRTMTDIDKNAADLLLGNALDFLNGGLEIVFTPKVAGPEMKLAVLSIQTCFELLAKYRIVRERGAGFVIKGTIPASGLLEASTNARIKTISFSECLKLIEEYEPFTPTEAELVKDVQNARNALAHFAATVDVEEYRQMCVWLTIRALAMFAAGSDRDQGEMQTHRRYVRSDIFEKLVNYRPYKDEAVDAAIDNIDTERVYRCWECLNDTMSLRSSDTYFCYCCGLTAGALDIGYANCAICNASRGVCFDPLNDQGNERYHGRCLYCGRTQLVSEWTDFGEDHMSRK